MRRCVLGVGTVLVACLLTAPIAAASPFHFKEFAQGALVSWTSCPGADAPGIPTVCHDYSLYYARFDSTVGVGAVGALNRGKEPFVAQYEDHEYVLFPNGDAEELSLVYGSSADVVGFYDKTHLTTAGMGAVTIQLIDINLETGDETPTGRSVALGAFRWMAASPIYRYGNDGPDFGGERHVSNRCQTFNANFHQRFTLGYVTGSVDGVPLTDLTTVPQNTELEPSDAPGGIFNNGLRIVDVSKRC
jgi:hypothetical protein